jgi:hypothetical protein
MSGNPGPVVHPAGANDQHPITDTSTLQRTGLFDLAGKIGELEAGDKHAGYMVASVCFGPTTFDFPEDIRDASGQRQAAIFIEPDDIVAWDARTGQLASWLGRAAMLGEEKILGWRGDAPLHVYETIPDWLRSHRDGIVILDWRIAAERLAGVTLAASTVEGGLLLKDRLTRAPQIMIGAVNGLHQA